MSKFEIIHPDDLFKHMFNEIIKRNPPPESIKHPVKAKKVRTIKGKI